MTRACAARCAMKRFQDFNGVYCLNLNSRLKELTDEVFSGSIFSTEKPYIPI